MRGPLTPFSLPTMNMEEGYNGGKPGQQQQQAGGGFGQKGDNGDGGGVNNKVKYTMPGVLHFIQHEWSNFELERSHWEIDRAELQVRTHHCRRYSGRTCYYSPIDVCLRWLEISPLNVMPSVD